MLGLSCLFGGCSSKKKTAGRCDIKRNTKCGAVADCPDGLGREYVRHENCETTRSECDQMYCVDGGLGVALTSDGL